jgi:glutathione S-transferase
MSDIVVYGVPGSPFMRAVQMGLEEKKAAYRVQVMGAGESKSEAYLKKHPFGRVPAFEHGNFGLYETQAILRYLDDIFPEPPLQPRDPQEAARMNQIIGINASLARCFWASKPTKRRSRRPCRWAEPASPNWTACWGRSNFWPAIICRSPI